MTRTKNGKFVHWSEHDKRVVNYLMQMFGAKPEKQSNGADLMIDGLRIEVKACREWNSANGGKRRRGRFSLHGYEDCDFFMFILIRDKNEIDMKVIPAKKIRSKYRTACSINWGFLFV